MDVIPMPKDLVVFLEASHGYDARLALAAALARRWQAHLIATFVVRELALDTYSGFAIGAGLTSMFAAYAKSTEGSISRAREKFDALTHHRSFTSEWRVSNNEGSEALMLHARHASLAVLGPPARQQADLTRLSLSERAIFTSGRPCLLLPEGWPAERIARRVVAGWNGGREAARAIADAMPFLVMADSVHLVVAPHARLRGICGPDPGADMATHLARHGVQVVLEQHTGEDAGKILLERCKSIDADLLVSGGCAHPTINDLVPGRATRTILEGAVLPLLMSR